MNKLTKTFLDKRGYSVEKLSFLNSSERDELMGTDKLISKLHDIHDAQDGITIVCDFDMDGIMSGVLGYAGLSELGFNVGLYVCDVSTGYGFDENDIDIILKSKPDTEAILTCDVGITCYEGCAAAKQRGLDVLVTDHHHVGNEELCADAIVDPWQLQDRCRYKDICGAHVLWRVLMNYAEKYCSGFTLEQIRRLCVFAGIGTVTDVMPLLFENREVVRDAVSMCKLLCDTNEVGDCFYLNYISGCQNYVNVFRGLYLLLQKLKHEEKICGPTSISSDLFGYVLGPMFNSLKRFGDSAAIGCKVFISNNALEQKQCIDYIYDLNEKRKRVVKETLPVLVESNTRYVVPGFSLSGQKEDTIVDKIVSGEVLLDDRTKQLKGMGIYISDSYFGFNGLFANSIMSKTGFPTFVVKEVVADDGSVFYEGSGRCPSWYDAFSRLSDKDKLSLNEDDFTIAGHACAFGVFFRNKDVLKTVFEFLKKDVGEIYNELCLQDAQDVGSVEPNADIVLSVNDDEGVDSILDIPLLIEFLHDIERLEPFGKDFEAPLIELQFKPQDGEWKIIGKTHEHLKVSLFSGLDVLLWNQADVVVDAQRANNCVVLGRLELSDWEHFDAEIGQKVTTRRLQFVGDIGWE